MVSHVALLRNITFNRRSRVLFASRIYIIPCSSSLESHRYRLLVTLLRKGYYTQQCEQNVSLNPTKCSLQSPRTATPPKACRYEICQTAQLHLWLISILTTGLYVDKPHDRGTHSQFVEPRITTNSNTDANGGEGVGAETAECEAQFGQVHEG